MTQDRFGLERFVQAQQSAIDEVRRELRQGRKCSHWMWFIFPQLKGLGKSWNADHYGISSIEEAQAYLRHPVLGPRLIECTKLVNAIEGSSAEEIFGDIDSVKFRSSMTLFAETDPGESAFTTALEKFFAGRRDPLTLELLKKAPK
jgi:uncharacterized protein (DUF1810 family)